VTRDRLVEETRGLSAEGERLQASPSLAALRTWLRLSDVPRAPRAQKMQR